MSQSISLNKASVLLLEDDPDQRELFSMMLETAGYTVIAATDALEALGLLAETEVQCIVSDVMLPGMDGQDFLKEVRASENHAQVPVVMLTASRGDLGTELLSGGADAFCFKKDAPRELLEHLRVILEES